jgi:hypothetical protein
MDLAVIKKLLPVILGILCAYVIADYLSLILVRTAGLEGPAQLVTSFITFAVIFFATLYIIERGFGISFFGFTGR